MAVCGGWEVGFLFFTDFFNLSCHVTSAKQNDIAQFAEGSAHYKTHTETKNAMITLIIVWCSADLVNQAL